MNETSYPQMGESVFTPVGDDIRRLEVRAECFPPPIDLDLLRACFTPTQVLAADPLVLSLTRKADVVAFRYGVVVFWQCAGHAVTKVLEEVQRVTRGGPPDKEVRDTLTVLVGQPEDRVNFRDIWLKELTLEHIRVISEALGRSVALRRCELSVARSLSDVTPVTQALATRGALASSEKAILRTVGFTLAVKETVLARLGLTDDPAGTWNSEKLSRLHALLHDHFDIAKRLASVNDKVSFLSDLNLMLLTLLQNRTSHRLEWIVILLIVVEVIFSSIHFFLPSH